MASSATSCPSCSKKYGWDDVGVPVILPCLCVFCKECALTAESEAQASWVGVDNAVVISPRKKRKVIVESDSEEEDGVDHQSKPPYTGGGSACAVLNLKATFYPTPCMNCSKPCAIPVSELKLDVSAMQIIPSGAGGKPAAAAAAAAAAALTPPAGMHDVATSAIEEAVDTNRDRINALRDDVIVARDEALKAAAAASSIRGELGENKVTVLKVISDGFRQLLAAAKNHGAPKEISQALVQRRKALEARVRDPAPQPPTSLFPGGFSPFSFFKSSR